MKIVKCSENQLNELILVAKQSFIEAFEKNSDPDNFKVYVNKAFTNEAVLEELRNTESIFYFLQTAEGENIGYVKLRWDRSDEFFKTERALELQRVSNK